MADLFGYSPAHIAAIPAMWALCIVPHFVAATVKIQNGAYNNANPRDDKDKVAKLSPGAQGLVKRMQNAAANGFENLPYFAAAALACAATHVDPAVAGALAKNYLLVRLAYILAYAWADTEVKSVVRSGLWFYSIILIFRMFGSCLTKA
ncbi:hypothetical protein DFJ74DRAFT_423074 [Hyaloraphidium curvatum]|nr:hypothetical protein DFJ74DRAFT_423074 [Hyaloraphidium curvatum]